MTAYPMELPSVALVGRAGSGKTAVADALIARHGFARHSWADALRTIAAMAYGPIDKAARYEVASRDQLTEELTGREVLQRLGTEAIRDNLDEDFLVKAGLRRLHPGVRYANDDTRFPNEGRAVARLGWCVVRLECSDSTRAARQGLEFLPTGWRGDHASERVDHLPVHFTISSEGSVGVTVEELVGRLATWKGARP